MSSNAKALGDRAVVMCPTGDFVDWEALGADASQPLARYEVPRIGEVSRPDPVNVPEAVAAAQQLAGFKPYATTRAYDKGSVRALLIGINYYGTAYQLKGCVQDVRNEMATFQKAGFPVDETVILVDDASFPNVTDVPNRANIIKYMAWLVKGAKAGDVLYMHYSGHATQTKSTEAAEAYDQVLCPSDFTTAGTILDNDLFAILAKDLPAGVRLTVLFDCCHSGTLMDLQFGYLVSRGGIMRRNRKDNVCAADVITYSGCMDAEETVDTPSGGALTIAFGNILRGGPVTYKRSMQTLQSTSRTMHFQLNCSQPLDLNSTLSLLGTLKLDNNFVG